MPDQTYEVVMHDGRKFRVVADHAPTEEEVLAHLPQTETAPPKLMASHEAPAETNDPSADARERILGTVGRYGGLLTVPAGPTGEALGRAMAHPDQWPTLAAGVAAPLTGGTSVLAPVAAAAGAGGVGSIAKNAAEYFLGQRKAPADVATDVAKDAAIQGGTQLAGGLVSKGLEAAAPRVMSAVLKPTTTLRRNNPGMNIPLEAVKQGAVVSKGGLAAQADKVRGLNDAVSRAIEASDATVKPSVAASSLGDLLRERQALGPVASADAAKIQDALVNFVGTDAPMPVAKAQEIKKFLGAKVASKFGSQMADPVSVDINQALRAGTKGAIAQAVPEVDVLNQQLSPAIAVRKALEQRLGTAQNTNVIPARVFMAHNPILAAASAVTGAPAIASRGANLMYRTGQTQVPANVLRAALLSMMGGEDASPQP
jgi:hypothetical protein